MLSIQFTVAILLICFIPCLSSAVEAQCDKTKYTHHTIASTHSRCLDGSPASFYLRTGHGDGANKWMVFFEGGAWCTDDRDCQDRSRTPLGSSRANAACTGERSGLYLDPSPDINPMMHNWNAVRVRYCDGGSYAGHGEGRSPSSGSKLYFRGQSNRDETIRSLLGLGMRAASEVVLLGCSAGALGVYLGIDEMARLIRAESPLAIVRGLAVSGYFLDYTPSKGSEWSYAHKMRSMFDLMNMSSDTSSSCQRARTAAQGDLSDCIFAASVAPFIRTPVFSVQSMFDSWQLDYILRDRSPSAINAYGQQLAQSMINAFRIGQPGSQHGLFVDSCREHCLMTFSASSDGIDYWNGRAIVSDGNVKVNMANAFYLWYASLLPDDRRAELLRSLQRLPQAQSWVLDTMSMPKNNLFVQNASYPCLHCCGVTFRAGHT